MIFRNLIVYSIGFCQLSCFRVICYGERRVVDQFYLMFLTGLFTELIVKFSVIRLFLEVLCQGSCSQRLAHWKLHSKKNLLPSKEILDNYSVFVDFVLSNRMYMLFQKKVCSFNLCRQKSFFILSTNIIMPSL